MPVTRDKRTGKWRIGNGKPVYSTKEKAEAAYRAYLARRRRKK